VGSTRLSQQLDAEDWRDVIAQYQQTTSAAVARFGGHVAKHLGDGLLIYFGWPTAREDDPERAIRAGLAILDAMITLNGHLSNGEAKPLSVRIGMHTGPVVVADGGEIFGETPNIAARVQTAAQPDTVVVTAATQRLAAGIFVVEDRGPQELKGVREPVGLYRVVRPSGVRSRLDIAAGRLTPFVGREMEIGTLLDRWGRVTEGLGQNVLLVADAGVGKSRLAWELRQRLATEPHTWLECRASPYTQGTPFLPVVQLVAKGLALRPDDSVAEKITKLERGLGILPEPLTDTLPVVARLLGLPVPERYPDRDHGPDIERQRTLEILAAWNLALGDVQPLVLLVEDLHWCDPSSLALLGRIIEQGPTARVLFIGTARPDFVSSWPARSNLTTLQLARLSERQAREMVTTVGGVLPEATVETLVARADGVPLYLEELTKTVAEPGAARTADAIPATLADSLMARLDRLSTAKEVAQRAAALGREFPYALLLAIADLDEAALRRGLARLVEAEILFVRGAPPAATYTFKHALVREAAYGSLLKRTRQQLHSRVVDVLWELFRERVTAEPEVLARHAEAAGRADDAITSFRLAGEQAQARSAHEEAIGHFRKAIVLVETQAAGAERDAREVSLQLVLGASLNAVRGYAHAESGAAYERAAALAEMAAGATWLGMARIGVSVFYMSVGEVERGRALLAEVAAVAEACGDKEQALAAHTNIAAAECYQGKFASSLMHSERALGLYDPAQHHRLVRLLGMDLGVSAQNLAATNLWFLGRPDAALTRVREAVALARRLAHPFTLAQALCWETMVHWYRRDTAAQCERAAELITLSEAQGFRLWLGAGRGFHAAARIANDPGAVNETMEGFALAAETGNQNQAPGVMLVLADAQRTAGQLAAARSTIAAGLAVAAQTGQPAWDADLQRVDGELLLATGGVADEAAAYYHRALTIAGEQGARSLELRAATSLARFWRAQGKRGDARDCLASVYASFTEGFDTRDLQDAKALLEELR
jgi:predicted ATPase/class 3 adenylate cyclase